MNPKTSNAKQKPAAQTRERQTVTKDEVGPAEAVVETLPAVIENKETAVGAAIDFSQYAGQGNENVRAADMAIPFLVILQKNSPQVDPDSPKYVEGAQVGMIYNTVSGELYDGKGEGILVVPCHFAPKVVEWVPRDAGGGWVASYDPDAPEVREAVRANVRDEKKKLINAKGNTMIDTAYHFVVLVKPDGQASWALIGMTSTQHKPSRQWNSLVSGIMLTGRDGRKFNPPRFSHVYRLTTAVEQKDQYTFYNWRVALVQVVDDPVLFESAMAFSKAVASGALQAGAPPQDGEPEPDHGAGDRADNRERPF